jgi:tetratricopeptide (TPR) repeat protein
MLFAQRESADVRRGNIAYKDSSYTDAEVHYRRGLDVNDQSFEGHFNLGDALFRQEKYPEALEQYAEAEKLLKANDKLQEEQLNSRLAATYHNIGNALYAQQQYDKAVAAYQQSLRHNPKDNDTRYNLVKAMQQLQQQQQQQNQQQNDQQNQQQNDSTQQQQQQQQQNQQQNQQPQQNEQQMDKETAEQILQALEQDEKETQEKLQRQQGKKRRVEKEW